MDTKIVIAIIGFSGVCIGAILQYIFTKYADERRHYRELKTKAYMDLIQGFSLLNSSILSKNEELQTSASRILTDAKMRIAIYGSKNVLRSLSKFWRFQEVGDSDGMRLSLINSINEMRREICSAWEGDLSKEVESMLFSLNASN